MNAPIATTTPQPGSLHRMVGADECEWDDTKLRHAYRPSNRQVSLCGYDGPSTWKDEWSVPSNVCPICIAILPEFLNLETRQWLKP
jgi:hypothetical protein